MPTALKLQEEFKDSLQTVFVEVGRANDAQMSAFAIDRGWYGGDGSDSAIWTKERPFDVGTGSIPAFALMDESGKVILSGTTSRMHKQIEEAIEEHDKARSKAPADRFSRTRRGVKSVAGRVVWQIGELHASVVWRWRAGLLLGCYGSCIVTVLTPPSR